MKCHGEKNDLLGKWQELRICVSEGWGEMGAARVDWQRLTLCHSGCCPPVCDCRRWGVLVRRWRMIAKAGSPSLRPCWVRAALSGGQVPSPCCARHPSPPHLPPFPSTNLPPSPLTHPQNAKKLSFNIDGELHKADKVAVQLCAVSKRS